MDRVQPPKLVPLADSSAPSSPLSPDEFCPYGKCGGRGVVSVESEDGYSSAGPCQCAKDKTKMRYLGSRFFGVTLEQIDPRDDKQARLKSALMQKPDTSIFLFGRGGMGKTHFLAAMYNYWAAKTRKIKYLDDATLKDELRNAELNKDFQFVDDLINDYKYIFFDDVGKAAMTPFHQSALYRFFNELYKNKKHIFITANDTLKLLGSDEYWGAHVARRVEDLCQLVDFS